MAKQVINIGASANDGNGDPLRNAFDKTNDNFNELYFALGDSLSATNLFDNNKNLDLTGKSHKVSFYYATKAALDAVDPNTYHGCIGHAHDTGKLYYAHGGAWVELANVSEIGGGSGSANTFSTIAISGQGNIVADSTSDTLTLVAGSNITLTSNTTSDSITIDAAGGGSSANTFGTIAISGQPNIVADNTTDTLTLVAGSNIVLTANSVSDEITISASGSGGSNSVNLNSVDAAVIDVAADSVAFIDADDSGNTKKDTIADFVAAIAGNNLTATNGVLDAAAGYSNSDVDAHLNQSSAGNGEVLSWNGSDYEWVAQSGGGTLSRTTQGVATTIANGATENIEFNGLGKSYALYRVTVTADSWIRIYSDTASRTADASRPQGQDPSEGAGIIAEFIATGGGSTTFKVTPAIYGWVDNSETQIPVAVTNNSGSSASITTTLVGLVLES